MAKECGESHLDKETDCAPFERQPEELVEPFTGS